MWILLGIVAAMVVLFAIRLLIRRIGGAPGPVSIAMFRNSPRNLTEADVRGAFRRAYGKEPEVRSVPEIDGLTRGFILTCGDLPALGVIDSTRGYLDHPAEFAQSVESKAVRAAVLEHSAWVSVDAMGVPRLKADQREIIYRVLGKLAAELYDHDCRLLYLPADERIALPGPDVEERMREGRVLEVFGDEEIHQPLIQVADDDPQIKRATEEAQRRLPEFLSAFTRRGEASNALFKACFKVPEGEEVIWMKLTSVGDGDLTGTIENPPVADSIPRLGAPATVKIGDVVDWSYIDEKDEPVGLFVDKILLKRGSKR